MDHVVLVIIADSHTLLPFLEEEPSRMLVGKHDPATLGKNLDNVNMEVIADLSTTNTEAGVKKEVGTEEEVGAEVKVVTMEEEKTFATNGKVKDNADLVIVANMLISLGEVEQAYHRSGINESNCFQCRTNTLDLITATTKNTKNKMQEPKISSLVLGNQTK